MKKNLTIIDLDSIIYDVAGNIKFKDAIKNLENIIDIQEKTKTYVNDILLKTEADCYLGYYQVIGHTNYRKIVNPLYKANRSEAPEFIKMWRKTIQDTFDTFEGVIPVNIIESDDAVSIAYYKFKDEYNITIARVDKDLGCLPGKHYNFRKKLPSIVTPEDALIFEKSQVLSGDAGDGVPGIFNIGFVKAVKFLVRNNMKLVAAFKDAYYTQKADPKIAHRFDEAVSWRRLFYITYHSTRLLHYVEDLEYYTDIKESNLFKIYSFDSKKVNLNDLTDW